MNFEVFITCALTGAGGISSRSDKVPLTPRDIAASAVEAAKAGAAIVHIHVRHPETGAPSRDPALYRETVARIRELLPGAPLCAKPVRPDRLVAAITGATGWNAPVSPPLF